MKLSLMSGMPTNILDESGMRVARCDFDGDFESHEATENAHYIVRCVNSYEDLRNQNAELLKALRDIANTNWHFSMSRKIAQDAIDKCS
jgi:hypothetical protein